MRQKYLNMSLDCFNGKVNCSSEFNLAAQWDQ